VNRQGGLWFDLKTVTAKGFVCFRAYSVVVSGTMPGKPMKNGEADPGLYRIVIVIYASSAPITRTIIGG